MDTHTIHFPPANPPLKATDEYLWHFTKQENLWNILCGSNGLLAGHTLFMKDTEDCSLLRRLNAIEIKLGSLLVSAMYSNVKIAESREELKKIARSGAYCNVFVACFTTTTREPKMWEEYTKDGGFAIGFDKNRLEEELASLSAKHRTILYESCDYSTFRQHSQTLDEIESKCEGKIKAGTKTAGAIAFIPLIGKIRDAANKMIFSKVPTLSWEHEKRLAYVFELGEVPRDRLRFIGGKPFVTVALSAPIASYVRCIRISPHGDVQKSRSIAHLVASSIGLDMDYVVDEQMT